jgi:hypothetical protein
MTEFEIDPSVSETEITVFDQYEQALQEQFEELNERIEQYIRQAVAATDWEENSVCDVVVLTHPDGSVEDMAVSFKHVAHSMPSMPTDEYVNRYQWEPTGVDVYRITEEKLMFLGIDPETGEGEVDDAV